MAETSQSAKPQTNEFPFAVSVGQVYDGPLDLLLDLVRKQDIDIYDIPIARITAQYLSYVESLKHLDVDVETVTVGQMIEFFRRRLLMEERPIRLKRLLQHITSRHALISSFLALLELVRLQAILLRQERIFGEVLIKKHAMFDTVMGEGAAVRDDWR